MILFNDIWRSCITLFILSGLSSNIYAQAVVFTAEAKSNKICLRDKVQLQYTIKDAVNLRSITKPYDTDFIIVGGPIRNAKHFYFLRWRQTGSVFKHFPYVYDDRKTRGYFYHTAGYCQRFCRPYLPVKRRYHPGSRQRSAAQFCIPLTVVFKGC